MADTALLTAFALTSLVIELTPGPNTAGGNGGHHGIAVGLSGFAPGWGVAYLLWLAWDGWRGVTKSPKDLTRAKSPWRIGVLQ